MAELPDMLMVALILAGVVYPILVGIGHKIGLAFILPSVFTPRGEAVAVSSLLFGLGLVIAGAKYAPLDPPVAKFFSVAGSCGLYIPCWMRQHEPAIQQHEPVIQ